MSEELKGDNVAPENTGNAETQEVNTVVNDDKNTVQYDTYKRVLSKLKNTESSFQELQEKIKTLENEKYEAEGNKDKLIESLRKEVTETKGKLKSTVGSVARSQAMNAIVEEAVKAGCNSPNVVKKFLEDQIETLSFDESFTPDRDEVRELVARVQKEEPVLFSKPAPTVANHNLSAGGAADSKPNLKKMKYEDLLDKLGDAL